MPGTRSTPAVRCCSQAGDTVRGFGEVGYRLSRLSRDDFWACAAALAFGRSYDVGTVPAGLLNPAAVIILPSGIAPASEFAV